MLKLHFPVTSPLGLICCYMLPLAPLSALSLLNKYVLSEGKCCLASSSRKYSPTPSE